jgi:cell division transport system permease protein
MVKKSVSTMPLALERNIPRAALSLNKDGIFKLLMLMTALLGWVIALATAGSLMMHEVYSRWQLGTANTLNVYLPADADATTLATLEQTLSQMQHVMRVEIVPPEQVQAVVAPYVGNAAELPLPVVLEVEVDQQHGMQQALSGAVQPLFATAEVDDSGPVLNAVAGGVRVMQSIGLGLAGVMAILMALLVMLTVQVGLRAQSATLHVLLHLGATDARLLREVVAQVLERTMLGWLMAVSAAAAILATSAFVRPELASVIPINVWLGLLVAPLVLPGVAVLVAAAVAGQVLRKG